MNGDSVLGAGGHSRPRSDHNGHAKAYTEHMLNHHCDSQMEKPLWPENAKTAEDLVLVGVPATAR